MRQDLSADQVTARLTSHGMRIQRRIPGIDIWVVEDIRSTRTTSPLKDLARDPDVLWVEPNARVHAVGITPNDSYYQVNQWYLQQINLPEAWVFTRGEGIVIAIIDSGVDLDHPDLAGKLWTNAGEVAGNGADDDGNGYPDDEHGWDFVGSDADPDDDYGHGSHVAGIAAAHTDNGAGIAGVGWQSLIMSLKVLNQQGEGDWDDVLAAMAYAADNGAAVLNLSLGQEPGDPEDPVPVQAVEDAVSYARSKGCLIVAAAGNNSSQPAPVMYPAAASGVMTVAATTASDAPWDLSNRGPEVDVAAPGVDIFSTTKNKGYTTLSGTSMATPQVGGLAALLWAFDPTQTAGEVTGVITSTARDVHTVGWDERSGWGLIDAQAAVLQLAQPEVGIAADPTSIFVTGETASITATVTYSQSRPVPDGLSVFFSSSFGQVSPDVGLTRQGEVTATFEATSGFGEALIEASVLGDAAASVVIQIVPYRFRLPLILRLTSINTL
jgi:subtilisin family serine protease